MSTDDVCIVGNLNVDLAVSGLRRLPDWGREVLGSQHVSLSAGQAGYWGMALSTLGTTVGVVGNVGEDSAGDRIVADLERAGVRTDDVERGAGTTGLTVALVRCDGERAFVTDLGCLVEVDEPMIRRHVGSLSSARVVCFVGVFMLPGVGLNVFTALAREARHRGQLTVVDTGWDPDDWSGSTIAAMRQLVAHTDLLLVNEAEAAALTGLDDCDHALAALSGWSTGTVVVKRGADGAQARSGAAVGVVESLQVDVHDSVGAGDVFGAGFVAAELAGLDLGGRLALGSATAGLYCSRERCRFPNWDEAMQAAGRLAPVVRETDSVGSRGAS